MRIAAIQQKLTSGFGSGVLWNVLSFGISGLIAIFLNILIVRAYDGFVLGVFNQIYALYILLSQLAVGGVHLSVQVLIPRYESMKTECDSIVSSALIIAVALSVVVCAVAFLFRKLPGTILHSEGVGEGFKYVIPGLLFFSMNKILLAFLNGKRFMKSFAIFQLLRFVFVLFIIAAFIWFNVNSNLLASSFVLAEVLLFVGLIVYCSQYFSFGFAEGFRKHLVENFVFGNRALLGNFLLDVNTRVDIFILGIFLSDKMVGIYSLASAPAEGFYQLSMILRNNINPSIAKASHTKDKTLVQRLVKSNIRMFYKILAPLGILTIVGFPLFLFAMGIAEDFWLLTLVYALLTGGVILSAGYQPFIMLFNQMGKPSLHTLFIFLLFTTNVALNFLFVPFLGVAGAALATGLTFVLQMVFQKMLFHRNFHLSI